MANVYVYSGAGGAGTGADWANAYTTLSAALTAKAAGDVFYVAHDHAESTAGAVTLTSPGTAASPCRIFCVNRAGSVPPVSADLSTTATIQTTGANNVTTAGHVSRCYGITFSAGDGANTASWTGGGTWHLKRCAIRLTNTSASSIIRGNNGAPRQIWEDTTCQFGAAGQGFQSTGRFEWKGTASAITGATLPNVFFNSSNNGISFFEGVDLSALSAKTLANIQTTVHNTIILKDCKLPASLTMTTGTAVPGGTELYIIRSDGGDTNYRTEKHDYTGVMTTETTIVRTGGASDGTTPIAWKFVTTANCEIEVPFTSPQLQIWNDTTGSSKTLTVYGIWGGGAVPNNDDIWLEVAYLGTSGFPLATVTHTSKADELAANSALATDSSTWGGSTTKFKMTATFTPQEKGPITVRIKVGAASSTFYIDPKLAVA